MQRIISRGEIENLDRTQVPTIYAPKEEVVFAQRAQRLRSLTEDSNVSAYLRLMTHVVDAQHALLQKHINLTGPSDEQIKLAKQHTSELQSRGHLVCRLLLEKKNRDNTDLRRKQ